MSNNICIATRESYGKSLVEIGRENSNLVVLDADLASATKTALFQNVFPDRHINCGIAEANMAGIAAGLASCGKIPVISTFAIFASGRCYEQVRNSIAYPHLNVKICATHGGITVGEDGATHQCIEDIALMRNIPGMVVLCPADDVETRAMLKTAIDYVGPIYMRLCRFPTPIIYNREEYKFQWGKAVILKEGSDISVFATGVLVSETLKAAELLENGGVSVEVINIHTIKPLDNETVLKSVSKTGKAITVEDHSIIGGLGTAISECLLEKMPIRLIRIGIEDCYGESGNPVELMRKYGLDAQGIYNRIYTCI